MPGKWAKRKLRCVLRWQRVCLPSRAGTQARRDQPGTHSLANSNARHNPPRDGYKLITGLHSEWETSMRAETVVAVCALLPLIWRPSPALAQSNRIVPAPLGKLIDVGGYRVHLYCIGAGSPAVVIVGAGYSFDWGLVQPEVATFTQVCSYDHSGIGWSDSGPKDSCSLRVSEVHTALKNAGIKGPYVLVGHSLGGLVARVYVGQHPDEVAGIVFVDHAFVGAAKGPPPSATPSAATSPATRGGRAHGL